MTILSNALNIKYALNGTGKSTIAKAIKFTAEKKPLTPLKPFSHIARNEKSLKPTVSNLYFSNVMVFDDDYVKQYVYQKTDILKDTFEVLINSSKYVELKEQIDQKFINIKTIARDKPNVSEIKEVLSGLCQMIAVNNDGKTLSRKTSGVKSLLDGGKGAIYNPPEALIAFKTFFEDEQSGEWASWKLKGILSFGEKGLCPFCAEEETEEKKSQTKLFQDTFDEGSINYANMLKEYITRISDYIDNQKSDSLLRLLNENTDRKVLERELIKLGAESSYLYERLNAISCFDGYSVDQSNINKIEQQLLDMKINESQGLDFFKTDAFFSVIRPLNEQIDTLIEMIGELKKEITKFQKYLREQVDSRKQDINYFLQSSGFNYSFDIKVIGDNQAHAFLSFRVDAKCEHEVSNPETHLSWGERNAFALILFMYDAISKNADLIILDDPISSFDSNKKYAIINRLFKTGTEKSSLYQRTVLFLTHDFEPVIDYIQVGGKLSGDSVCAHYLQNEKGKVCELQIRKNKDMMSLVVLMKELATDKANSMPVRVGCLRKYIEHTTRNPKENSNEYNILSSLIHGRMHPTYDSQGKDNMTPEDYERGCAEIQKIIHDFDYSTSLKSFEPAALLNLFIDVKNNFYRILILRAYTERNPDARNRIKRHDDVLRKYVDETYHIENDYLYSLDIRSFNIVPQHYCDNAIRFVLDELKYLEKVN